MAKPEEKSQDQGRNRGFINIPKKGRRKNKGARGARFAELPLDHRGSKGGASKKFFQPLVRSEIGRAHV
jgi:rubredoxin